MHTFNYVLAASILVVFGFTAHAQNIHERHMERAHPTPDPEYRYDFESLPKLPFIQGTSRYVSGFENRNMIIDEMDVLPVQNESSIAINPLDPNVLIGSAVDYRNGSTTKAYYSHDGGRTWDNVDLGQARSGWASSNDPSVCFDHLGRGYLCYGGFNRQGSAQFGENGVFVSLTDDGGKTWTQKHIAVIIHTGPQTADSAFEDKYYVHVDTATSSPYRGTLYIPWKRVINTDSSTQIVIARSTDRGLTWLPPVAVSDRFSGTSEATTFGQSFPLARTGPDGSVHLVWNSGTESSVRYARSTDGGVTWTSPRIIHTYEPFGEKITIAGQSNSRVKGIVRAEAYPTLAIDNTGGANNGNLYLVWAADNEPNIYFSRSTDNGDTWSTPTMPLTDPSNDQFWPWIAVDPTNGDIAVMYFDSRDDEDNILVNCYVSYSSDGGQTWTDRRVGDDENDLRRNPFSGRTFAGDYSGCDFYAGKVYPSWVDMRHTTELNMADNDVYTALINVNAPAAPEEFSATTIADQPTQIALDWSAIDERSFGQPLEPNETRYIVLRDSEPIAELALSELSYLDTGLESFREYHYTLYVVSGSDTSAHRHASAYAGGSRQPGIPEILSVRGDEQGSMKVTVRLPTKRLDGTTALTNLLAVRLHKHVNDSTAFFEVFEVSPSDTGKVMEFQLDDGIAGWYPVHADCGDQNGYVSPNSDTLVGYTGTLEWSKEEFSSERRYWNRSGDWGITRMFAFSQPASYTETPSGPYGRSHRDTVILFPRRLTQSPMRLSWRVAAFIDQGDTASIVVSMNNIDATEQRLAWWNASAEPRWTDTTKGDDAWRWGSAIISGTIGDTAYLKLIFRSNVSVHSDGLYIDDLTIDDLTSVDEHNIVLGTYPQPASSHLTIGLSKDQPATCTVYDVNGAEQDVHWYQSGSTLILDVKGLSSGMYMLSVRQGMSTHAERVFVFH